MLIGMHRKLYNAELRNRRKALGLTQRQLAEKCGVHVASVCQLESFYRVAPEALATVKIAAFLNVDPEVICPKWLKMIELMRVEEDRQVEIDQQMLESRINPLRPGIGLVAKSSVDRDVEKKEVAACIRRAVQLLSPKKRTILSLFYGLDGEQKSMLQIAEMLKVSRAYIAWVLREVEGKLRCMIDQEVAVEYADMHKMAEKD